MDSCYCSGVGVVGVPGTVGDAVAVGQLARTGATVIEYRWLTSDARMVWSKFLVVRRRMLLTESIFQIFVNTFDTVGAGVAVGRGVPI